MPLDMEGLFDVHAKGLGETTQVVAQQVNNHQVFGAVFRVGGEGGGRSRVRGIVACCGRGALHR